MVKNGFWYFLGFIALAVAFVFVGGFFGPFGSNEIEMIVLGLTSLVVVFVLGNWIAWKKLP